MKKAGGAVKRALVGSIGMKSNKTEDSRSETDSEGHSKTVSSNQSTEIFANTLEYGMHKVTSLGDTVANTVGGLVTNFRRDTQTDEHQSAHKSNESSSKHQININMGMQMEWIKDNTIGMVRDMMDRRKTVTDGNDAIADQEVEQKTLSTRFVERM